MSSRTKLWSACRALAVRSRPIATRHETFTQTIRRTAHRKYSEDVKNPVPKQPEPTGKPTPETVAQASAQAAPEAPSRGTPETPSPVTPATPSQAPTEQLARQIQESIEDIPQDEIVETTPGATPDEPIEAIEEVQEEAIDETTLEEISGKDEPMGEPMIDDATLEAFAYGSRVQNNPGSGALTDAQEEALYREGTIPLPDEAEAVVAASEAAEAAAEVEAQTGLEEAPAALDEEKPTHKFPLPQRPFPEGFHVKKRYHPVLEQIVRLLMKDGKLSNAQRNLATVMNMLRTAPAPIYSPKYPLIPGAPPAAHLPLNPVLYLTIAIDSVAPLVKVTYVKGAAGGGRALELPVPLRVRQRRRMAFKWILDVVNKKPSKGSGRQQFPARIAEEIIAVVEGRSSVWDRRSTVHKLGTAARANVGSNKLKVKARK